MEDDKLLAQSMDLITKSDPYRTFDYTRIQYFFKFYALPIFSAAIFFGILFLAIVPTIKDMFRTVDVVDALKAEDKVLNGRIEKIIALENQNTLRASMLKAIDILIPTGNSEVVKFRDRVAKVSIQQNLLLQSANIGEQIKENSATEKNQAIVGFNLVEIPTEFNISGLFFDFRAFLKKLYVGQDFFIVNEMKVSSAPTDTNPDNWNGDFTLTKYQFLTDQNFVGNQQFKLVSENSDPDQVVITFLQETFLNNKITDNQPSITPTP
ncbi:MAG: hypothetical protein WCJ58_01810 [bacterium]